GRHPFECILMRAENALEIEVAGGCRGPDAKIAMRYRDLGRKKEKERDGEQKHDCSVGRDDNILWCSVTNIELSLTPYNAFTAAAAVCANAASNWPQSPVLSKIVRISSRRAP